MDIKTQPKNDPVLLSWEAPTRHAHDHTKRWYAVMGTVLMLMLLYSLWSRAWSFTVVLVIAAGTYLYLHRATPEQKTVSISEEGCTFGEERTAWMDCSGFWVIETPDYAELHIARKDPRQGELVILTGSVDLLQLRTILRQFLEEIPNKNEKLFDTISRVCKL